MAKLDFGTDPVTGERRRRRRSASTKTAAGKLLQELRKEREELTTSEVTSVGDLLDLWLELAAPQRMGDKEFGQSGVDRASAPEAGTGYTAFP